MPLRRRRAPASRRVPATHGRRRIAADPAFEIGLADDLRAKLDRERLLELYRRFASDGSYLGPLFRRAALRALCRRFGNSVTIGLNVSVMHPETFEIGDGVFIGDQVVLQGRFDGICKIGAGTWIGPQSYFDARDLVIGENVGWGPGAKILGSTHTADSPDVPVIATDLEIRPVRIEAGADVGVNAVLLPGVRIGAGSLVGAGAVVIDDVPSGVTVAGVPARIVNRQTASHS